MKVGVLALQGDFGAHQRALDALGVQHFQVRNRTELERACGLILPGGESTAMLKLLEDEDLVEPLKRFVAERPTLATCAGVILLATRVTSPEQRSLSLLDVTVERNAYGRQVHSSIRSLDPSAAFTAAVGAGELEAVFIRAPIIRAVGPSVETLACAGEDPVLVRQAHILAATFHPELSADRRVHRLFLDTMRAAA